MKDLTTFHDHIKELRKRLFLVVLFLFLFSLLGYIFKSSLINFILKPLGLPTYYTNPSGSFNFTMKISFLVGLFLSIPVLVYEIIKFIEPALNRKFSNLFVLKTVGAATTLSTLGAAFGFFFIIPVSLHFFSGFSSSNLKPLISANDYLNYVVNILISFALLFQIPIIIFFIDFIKPLKPKMILKYQKVIVISALIISVILPFTYDPISQFIVALPIIFLYYLSVVLIGLKNKYGRYREADVNYLNLVKDVDVDEIYLASNVKAKVVNQPALNVAPTKQPKNQSMDGLVPLPYARRHYYSLAQKRNLRTAN